MPTADVNQAPLFTVVMPAYKAAATIGVAIASVLHQTEGRFELIVVDDGSPDDTTAQAEAAAAGDPRVRVIRQENAGPAIARNHGIAQGTSRLVAFLDADDRWAPDALARHRDHFDAVPSVGVSFGRIRFYDPALTAGGRASAHVPVMSLALSIGENPICTTSNLVARREVFARAGGFNPALTHAEDQEWVARVLASTRWDVCGIDAILVDYRTSAGGLSADLTRMRDGWRTMIDGIRALAPAKVGAAEAEASALFERYLARRALRIGQPAASAFSHLWTAFRHSPIALLKHAPRRTLLTAAGILAASLLPPSLVRAAVVR